METVKLVLDLVLVVCKLLGQVPEMMDKYKIYKQDEEYKTTSEKLDKAFNDFVAAKATGNQQAMLDAAWNATHKEKK